MAFMLFVVAFMAVFVALLLSLSFMIIIDDDDDGFLVETLKESVEIIFKKKEF